MNIDVTSNTKLGYNSLSLRVNNLKIAFFGTPQFAVTILNELSKAGFTPSLIITTPDKPQGRHLTLTPPPVKVWAQEKAIEVFQPETLKSSNVFEKLNSEKWDVFIVAAYGKIISQKILDIPTHKTLNIHPSLLPKFRGSSPIESAILHNEKETGVTIMRLDAEMDHGPIVTQKTVSLSDWPLPAPELENILATEGGELLASILPNWTAGKITEQEQDHSKATFTEKISKVDGEIDLNADPHKNYLKICAYAGWPTAYFFVQHAGKRIRVTIKDATFTDGTLTITRVIPQGKKEMSYEDFKRGLKS